MMTISKATGPVLVMTLKQKGLIRVQNSLYIQLAKSEFKNIQIAS